MQKAADRSPAQRPALAAHGLAARRAPDHLGPLQSAATLSPAVLAHTALQRLADAASGVLQREELEDLAMDAGGLADFGDTFEIDWTALSAELATFAAGPGADLLLGDESEKGMFVLPPLTLRPDGSDGVSGGVYKPNPDIPTALSDKVYDFMMGVMRANGQMAYIAKQPWFKDGSYKVIMEMNYYHERAFNPDNTFIGMHKDTDSRNIFVNLVFNNTTAIPATEWILDPAVPDDTRLAELGGALPPAELKKIMALKAKLRAERLAPPVPDETPRKGLNRIEGGKAPKHAYVSWVDEMVWHSTPTTAGRATYSRDLVERMIDRGESEESAFVFYEAALKMKPHLGRFTLDDQLADMDAWIATADDMREGVASGDAGWTDFRDALKGAADLVAWDTLSKTGDVGGVEQPLPEGGTYNRQVPTEIGGRRRANSIDPTAIKDVEDAILAMKGGDEDAPLPKRSFIRTWVTVNKT